MTTRRYLMIVVIAFALYIPALSACGSSDEDGDGTRDDCTLFDNLDDRSHLDDPCYLVQRRQVVDDRTLSVAPGTIVYFEDRAGLHIDGQASLKIEGTADDPVTFRGHSDRFGAWRGLHITAPGPHQLDHLHLRGGGDDRWDLTEPFTQAGLLVGHPDADLSLRHAHLSFNAGAALSATAGASLTIEASHFHDNDLPLRITPHQLQALGPDNHFQDNRHHAITLHVDTDAPLTDDAHWPALDVPLRLDDVLTVEASLHIDAPNTLLFGRHAGLDVGDGGRLLVDAHLDEPVTFRGTTDDAGHWRGLRIHASNPLAPSRLAGVEILHGASQRWDPNWSNSQANLLIHKGGHLHLSDALIAHSDYHGISVRDATLQGCDDVQYDSNRRHDRHHYDGDDVCF